MQIALQEIRERERERARIAMNNEEYYGVNTETKRHKNPYT